MLLVNGNVTFKRNKIILCNVLDLSMDLDANQIVSDHIEHPLYINKHDK